MSIKSLAPIHPGEILREEFLVPFGLSQYRLACAISVPPRRINEIVLGKRGITTDTAVRLGMFFRMTAEFWMNLQTHFDLETLKRSKQKAFEREVEVYSEEMRRRRRRGDI